MGQAGWAGLGWGQIGLVCILSDWSKIDPEMYSEIQKFIFEIITRNYIPSQILTLSDFSSVLIIVVLLLYRCILTECKECLDVANAASAI